MLSERFFEARNASGEYPNTGSFDSPSVSLISAVGGGPTTSGVRINPRTAEGIPAWFACRQVISETVGQIPLKTFRRLPRGGKRPDEGHGLYHVLHDQFNPEWIAYEGKEYLTRCVADWGNGYAEIDWSPSGSIRALWPLAPERMTVDRDGRNRKRFRYRNAAGEGFEWIHSPARPPIFHLRANTQNGLTGRSAIRILADCFGLTKAAEEFGARFFANGMVPSAVATYDKKLTPEQKQNLRESWQRVHGGLSNSHRLAILEHDIKLEKLGIDPEAGQFIQTRGLQIEEIARILRVPLFLIQHMTKSTSWGSGIEQMMRAFLTITLMPWLTMWQQSIGRDLLTRKSFETHTALFVVNALVAADFQTRMTGYKTQLESGLATPNEIRALEDLNPRDDEFGDEPMVPINNAVPASLAKEILQSRLLNSDGRVVSAEPDAPPTTKPVDTDEDEDEDEEDDDA